MTGEERKKRGEQSAAIVERLVRLQLRAMGCERFDIGIKRDAGEMILRERQADIDIEKTIKWLRHENAKGAHIYIRPAGAHSLTLLADLSWEAIKGMKAEGYEPTAVVETSPNNFQAWLNHGQVLDAATSTRAAKQLAERFGGDPSSADWRHFGRLAGFTNPKPGRQLPSGICDHLRGCDRRRDVLTPKRRSSSPPSDQAMRVKKCRVRSHRNGGAGVLGARRLDRLKNSTQLRPMPGIFTVPTWHGRNTLRAVA